MSSAILYLAIVAIWACVLIPRWLRRDSAHGPANATADAAGADATAGPDAVFAGAGPADVMSETVVLAMDSGSEPDSGPDRGPGAPPVPLSAEESRRRMLAARRRLLGMLAALEAAAIALAVIGLAAPWVVIPPTIMLAGYLLLLREAAQADAELARRDADAAAARTAARAAELARSSGDRTRAAQRATPVEGTPLPGTAAASATAASAAEFAARFAAAPVPADYEEPGRDFAPGLAGKYTAANADAELADEDYYYEIPRLRAVGD